MQIFNILGSLDKDQWHAVQILMSGTVALGGMVGLVSGILVGARRRRDRKLDIDRDNVIVESAIFVDEPDGSISLDIETGERLLNLHEVFGNPHLEAVAKRAVNRCIPGDPLFKHGHDHHEAMKRVCLAVTGLDPAATQAAMFGRHDDYHVDSVSVLLTCARGDDGIEMPRILRANPAWLTRLIDPSEYKKVVPKRQVYEPYLRLFGTMAVHAAKSRELFDSIEDERKAGSLAPVWTAHVRTHKV